MSNNTQLVIYELPPFTSEFMETVKNLISLTQEYFPVATIINNLLRDICDNYHNGDISKETMLSLALRTIDYISDTISDITDTDNDKKYRALIIRMVIEIVEQLRCSQTEPDQLILFLKFDHVKMLYTVLVKTPLSQTTFTDL